MSKIFLPERRPRFERSLLGSFPSFPLLFARRSTLSCTKHNEREIPSSCITIESILYSRERSLCALYAGEKLWLQTWMTTCPRRIAQVQKCDFLNNVST